MIANRPIGKAYIDIFDRVLQRELKPESWEWLRTTAVKIRSNEGQKDLSIAFTAMPKHTGKAALYLNDQEKHELNHLLNGLSFYKYTTDRLARVWLLLQIPSEEKSTYLRIINQLFKAAEMNELIALYSALPLLAYPEEWTKQCAEGIRSNVGGVLEAIMCNNPYPSEHLDEGAWNQMVLKAFFTDKPINRIVGLDSRSNKLLANILSDYAHERWAAGRTVDPQLWRLTTNFIDERIYQDIEKVFQSGTRVERSAAALVCYQNPYVPAKLLVDQDPELRSAIENKQINWEFIADDWKQVQLN